MSLITIRNISGREINIARYPFKSIDEHEIDVSAGAMQEDVDNLVAVGLVEIVT